MDIGYISSFTFCKNSTLKRKTVELMPEVLEGSSGEDEAFGRIFLRSRTRRGFFPFSSAFSRTRRGIPRNFGLFLSHFKDETSDPCFSRLRTRQGEDFCLIPQPFRGREETLESLWDKGKQNSNRELHGIWAKSQYL